MILVLLSKHVAGDPDTWPTAAVYIVGIVSSTVAVLAWFKWGKPAYNEAERIASDERKARRAPPTWTNETTKRTITASDPDADERKRVGAEDGES